MVSGRRGAGNLGCLLSLLLFVAALYYGVHVGEVYLRYYRLLDAMRFQASIAPSVTDEVIKRRLMATADSLLGHTPTFQVVRAGTRPGSRSRPSTGIVSTSPSSSAPSPCTLAPRRRSRFRSRTFLPSSRPS